MVYQSKGYSALEGMGGMCKQSAVIEGSNNSLQQDNHTRNSQILPTSPGPHLFFFSLENKQTNRNKIEKETQEINTQIHTDTQNP